VTVHRERRERCAPAVWQAKQQPREYQWDLSAYRGKTVRIVLKDDDVRPGCHLFCGGFHILSASAMEGQDFGRFMVNLAAKHDLSPMARFDTKHFTALSNAGDDYSEAQQEAWAAAVEDEEAFGRKLAGQLTLIATIQGAPVGFASLKGADHIEMLYVHPSVAGHGVASMLVEALEKLAGGRGAKNLTVDASDTAEPFFKKRGYVAMQRNTVTLNGEWLANTTMQKTLADSAAPGAPT